MPGLLPRPASSLSESAMTGRRSKNSLLAFAALALTVAALPARAQDWPQQPIHMIVPFGPGGGSDLISRILAEAMEERLGKAVVVENKPGAGGIIGNEFIARAKARWLHARHDDRGPDHRRGHAQARCPTTLWR